MITRKLIFASFTAFMIAAVTLSILGQAPAPAGQPAAGQGQGRGGGGGGGGQGRGGGGGGGPQVQFPRRMSRLTASSKPVRTQRTG
jgi:hypothetical protein